MAVLQQLQAESADQLATQFARRNASEPGLNVLVYIVTSSNMLRDRRLDELLAAMLFKRCCIGGAAAKAPRGCTASWPSAAEGPATLPMQQQQKRESLRTGGNDNGAAGSLVSARIGGGGGGGSSSLSSLQPPQKKQRFHAWGGKRSRGGGATQAQVVIRAPFHAWGGRK